MFHWGLRFQHTNIGGRIQTTVLCCPFQLHTMLDTLLSVEIQKESNAAQAGEEHMGSPLAVQQLTQFEEWDIIRTLPDELSPNCWRKTLREQVTLWSLSRAPHHSKKAHTNQLLHTAMTLDLCPSDGVKAQQCLSVGAAWVWKFQTYELTSHFVKAGST